MKLPKNAPWMSPASAWGLVGKVDAVRRRDGAWVAIEHKRGRCRRDEQGRPQAWPSDRIQAVAYAVLVEEGLGEPVPQARVRYHADGVTAFVDIDDAARARPGRGHRPSPRAAAQHPAAAGDGKRKPLPAVLAGAGLFAGGRAAGGAGSGEGRRGAIV